jgi:uncharacterized membrane protein required for colicin V production
MWIDVIVILILFFSFIGGIRAGAVNMIFSLLTTIIAILITGALYGFVANWLSFLPGENWESFLGFLITLVIVSIILALLLLLPRHIIKAIWSGGCASGIIGGVLGLVNSAIGIFILALLIQTYPILEWLRTATVESAVLSSILQSLGFLRFLLPEAFRGS